MQLKILHALFIQPGFILLFVTHNIIILVVIYQVSFFFLISSVLNLEIYPSLIKESNKSKFHARF